MASESSIEVGSQAPDFSLPGTGDKNYSLSQFRGTAVVLVFYPGDSTAVCTKQLCSYNDELSQFSNVGAQVLAISHQDMASHDKFAAKHNFKFPLLSDPDKQVLSDYGVVGFAGLPRRSVFVIDPNGVVKYLHRALVGVTFRPVKELIQAVADAQTGI
ncbi:MAG: peroxiredoxin [Actinobacteria bacterium]|nr:peroxiredoxin [Actinomycetota bacterium]